MGLEKIQATMMKHLKLGEDMLKLRKLGIIKNSEYNRVVGGKPKPGVIPEYWPHRLCVCLILFGKERPEVTL